ncbi:MAG: hypothetical protein D6689_04190 [Deltaproteobacteria bacterium]|nr:MAG: hypothetical protein D6689_04190 [Deltaproteobacteria bacterium]
MIVRLATALCVAAPVAAQAGGQYVADNGGEAIQRGGAFVAKADDATALYYNPAGLLGSGSEVFVGFNVVSMEQSFQRAGEYAPQTIDPGGAQPDYVGDPYPRIDYRASQPVPFVAVRFGRPRYAFGLGVFAPPGFGKRDYPQTVRTRDGDEAPAPQRYDAVSQDGIVVFPSAGFAVRLSDRLDAGLRATLAYARVRSTRVVQGVPNRGEEPGRDIAVTVDATDPGAFTYALGFRFRASDDLEIGGAYAAATTFHAEGVMVSEPGANLQQLAADGGSLIVPVDPGDVRCAPGGTPQAVRACLDMTLPATATIGARVVARDDDGAEIGDLEVDVRWEKWTDASAYRVRVDGRSAVMNRRLDDTAIDYKLRDVYSVRVGASRIVRGAGGRRYHLRGGVAYDTEAVPESWTTLNVDGAARLLVAGGIGIEWARTRIDVGAARIGKTRRQVREMPVANPDDVDLRQQPDAPVPLLPGDELPYHPINTGTYETGYSLVSVALTRRW